MNDDAGDTRPGHIDSRRSLVHGDGVRHDRVGQGTAHQADYEQGRAFVERSEIVDMRAESEELEKELELFNQRHERFRDDDTSKLIELKTKRMQTLQRRFECEARTVGVVDTPGRSRPVSRAPCSSGPSVRVCGPRETCRSTAGAGAQREQGLPTPTLPWALALPSDTRTRSPR